MFQSFKTITRFIVGIGCVLSASNAKAVDLEKLAKLVPQDSKQVLVTIPGEGVALYQKTGMGFTKTLGPWAAVYGKKGLARAGEKREGDKKTPVGVYELRRSFGYLPTVQTGLDYKQVGPDDIWIDDPNSRDYNLWLKLPTTAKSYEKLRLEGDEYKRAVVVEYNTSPVVKGMGSAIFIHIWENENKGTSGCIAMAEANMEQLMVHLDTQLSPVVVISAHSDLSDLLN